MKQDKNWLYRLLFGFGGASLGAVLGVAASIFLMFACSAAVGAPEDLGAALSLGAGAVLGCAVAGAIIGARLSRKG